MSAIDRATADLDRALPMGTWMSAAELEEARARTPHSIYAWRAARRRLGVRAYRAGACWVAYRGLLGRLRPADASVADRSDISAVVEHTVTARSRTLGAAIREHWPAGLALWAIATTLAVAAVYAW